MNTNGTSTIYIRGLGHKGAGTVGVGHFGTGSGT